MTEYKSKKLEKLEQQEKVLHERIKDEKKRIKAQARKARNHNLIEYGAIAEKTNGINADSDTIKNQISLKIRVANSVEKMFGFPITDDNISVIQNVLEDQLKNLCYDNQVPLLPNLLDTAKNNLAKQQQFSEQDSEPPYDRRKFERFV